MLLLLASFSSFNDHSLWVVFRKWIVVKAAKLGIKSTLKNSSSRESSYCQDMPLLTSAERIFFFQNYTVYLHNNSF